MEEIGSGVSDQDMEPDSIPTPALVAVKVSPSPAELLLFVAGRLAKVWNAPRIVDLAREAIKACGSDMEMELQLRLKHSRFELLVEQKRRDGLAWYMLDVVDAKDFRNALTWALLPDGSLCRLDMQCEWCSYRSNAEDFQPCLTWSDFDKAAEKMSESFEIDEAYY